LIRHHPTKENAPLRPEPLAAERPALAGCAAAAPHSAVVRCSWLWERVSCCWCSRLRGRCRVWMQTREHRVVRCSRVPRRFRHSHTLQAASAAAAPLIVVNCLHHRASLTLWIAA